MRIGISARGLSTAIGGTRRVLDEILNGLPTLEHRHDVISYQESGTPVSPGVDPVWVDAPHPVLWEHMALPRALDKTRPDVLLAPKTLLPGRVPSSIKTVSIVYDLLYFPIRGNYIHEYKWQDILYNRLFYRSSCRRASSLVCISECTRRDLLDVCPMPPDKVSVVHLGVSAPPADAISRETVDRVKHTHRLDAPYIFYAGSLSPRKNMVRGVQAWARIADRVPHHLVVTAGKSWRDDDVERAVAECGLLQRFHRLGVIPQGDMPTLYAGADLFFFPSLYEGFGLPVLEAMACGCPVVSSNASSLPEAAGDAARYVDPESVEGMAQGLLDVLSDASRAERLKAAGFRRVSTMTWQRFLTGVLAVIEAEGSRG
jgi:glycosyltransferase involved in cell wall biosynthesis